MSASSAKPSVRVKPGVWQRFWEWLPAEITSRVRFFAWLSFIAEVLIIGTGGTVRLTGSGLGCSEWPLCTPESLVPTKEMGIHGIIEFGNRTLTGLVAVLALIVLVVSLRLAKGKYELILTARYAVASLVAGAAGYGLTKVLGADDYAFSVATALVLIAVVTAAAVTTRRVAERKDLVALAWIVFAGVIAQAFVGGITVLTGLNPWIVGFHYVSSLILVCVTTVYIIRLKDPVSPRVRAVPLWFAITTHFSGLLLAVTIVFGVLTTGSGPHSGDPNVLRDGFDASLMAHIHSWPGYALAAVVAVLTGVAVARRLPVARWLLALIALIVVQEFIGVWQARAGLPILLVGIHMVLAALTAAAYSAMVLRLKKPAVRTAPDDAPSAPEEILSGRIGHA